MEAAGGAPPLFVVVRTASGPADPPGALREAVEAAGERFAFEPARGIGGIAAAVERGLEAGYRRFIVVGSDAAVSRAADVLLSAGGVDGWELGVVPAGPAHDIATALGISSVGAAVAAAVSGETRLLDVGRVTLGSMPQARHFVVAAAAGWMPPARNRIPRLLRGLPGDAGLMAGAAAQLARSPARSFTLTVDGTEHDGRYAAVSVHNLSHWQGGLLAAPGASPEDALLDVLQWRDGRRMTLLRGVRGQAAGDSPGADGAIGRCPGRIIEVSSPRATQLVADGSVFGPLPARVEVVPRALPFIVPAG